MRRELTPEDQPGEQLTNAAKAGDVAAVTALLDRGAEVNFASPAGATALMLAASRGHTAVVKILLDRRATVNFSQRPNTVTALMLAANNGHTATVTTLLDGQADVNFAQQPEGWTALMLAASGGHAAVVEILLNRGADVNFAQQPDGATALMLAVNRGHAAVVEILLNRGADVNAAPRGAILVFAANGDQAEIVNQIITHTALSQRNNGADWQVMVFGNQAQRGQIIPLVQNLLTRETATLLATILPEGKRRNSIIENFNTRNPANPLNQEAFGEIDALRGLKQHLVTQLLEREEETHSTPSSSSSSSSAARPPQNEDRVNAAEALANKVIGHLATNLENYNPLEQIERPSKEVEAMSYCDLTASLPTTISPEDLNFFSAEITQYIKRFLHDKNDFDFERLSSNTAEPTASRSASSAATEVLPPPPNATTEAALPAPPSATASNTSSGSTNQIAPPPTPERRK